MSGRSWNGPRRVSKGGAPATRPPWSSGTRSYDPSSVSRTPASSCRPSGAQCTKDKNKNQKRREFPLNERGNMKRCPSILGTPALQKLLRQPQLPDIGSKGTVRRRPFPSILRPLPEARTPRKVDWKPPRPPRTPHRGHRPQHRPKRQPRPKKQALKGGSTEWPHPWDGIVERPPEGPPGLKGEPSIDDTVGEICRGLVYSACPCPSYGLLDLQ